MKRTATGNPAVMTLIARIHLTWKRHLERALVGQDVTLKQYHLLVQLDEHEYLHPAQVAEELFCDRPTASVILRNMEKRGWISRRPDPVDKRQVRIRLLAAGRRKMERIRTLPALTERFRFDPCGTLPPRRHGRLRGIPGRAPAAPRARGRALRDRAVRGAFPGSRRGAIRFHRRPGNSFDLQYERKFSRPPRASRPHALAGAPARLAPRRELLPPARTGGRGTGRQRVASHLRDIRRASLYDERVVTAFSASRSVS